MKNSLLPPNATTLELHIEESARHTLLALSPRLRYNKNPDLIDANLLDLLAQDFSVDFWNENWSENKKRSEIKPSIEIQKHKGTLHGLRLAIEKITQDYQITEWFHKTKLPMKMPFRLSDGSGIPNTVEIILSVSSSTATIKEAMAAIESSKPLHVHTNILISESATAELQLIAAGYCETHASIFGVAA